MAVKNELIKPNLIEEAPQKAPKTGLIPAPKAEATPAAKSEYIP